MIKIALADLFSQLPLDQLKVGQLDESPDLEFLQLLQQFSLAQPQEKIPDNKTASVQVLPLIKQELLAQDHELDYLLQDIIAVLSETQEEENSDLEDIQASLATILMQADIKPYVNVGTETETMPHQLVTDRNGERPVITVVPNEDNSKISEVIVSDYNPPEAFAVFEQEAREATEVQISSLPAEDSSLPAEETFVMPQTSKQQTKAEFPKITQFAANDAVTEVKASGLNQPREISEQVAPENLGREIKSESGVVIESRTDVELIKLQNQAEQAKQPETLVSASELVMTEEVGALSREVTLSKEIGIADFKPASTMVLEPVATKEQQVGQAENVFNLNNDVSLGPVGLVNRQVVVDDNTPETRAEQSGNMTLPESSSFGNQVTVVAKDSLSDGDLHSSTSERDNEQIDLSSKKLAPETVFAEHVSTPTFIPETEQVSVESRPSAGNIFEQIVEQLSFDTRQDVQEVTIHLKPDYLGDVRIKLTSESGSINADFMIGNDIVREIITQSIPQLRTQLESLGMSLGHVNVNVGDHQQEKRRDNFARQQLNQQFSKSGTNFLPVIGNLVVHKDTHSQINLRI